MDCWIAIFVIAESWCEHLPWGNTGAFLAFSGITLECIIPYMAGKLLLEQPGMRTESVRRLIVLTAIASVLAMPEFFLKWNPYVHFWSHFFPAFVITQERRGFGRLGGPYSGPEAAGMVLLMVLLIAIWVTSLLKRYQRPLRYGKIIIFTLFAAMLMTQSRGPWIGLIVALCISWIGRARLPIRRAVLVFGLLLTVGVPLYSFYTNYLKTAGNRVDNETQTAQYREQMVDNYVPIAKLGGAWGWGNLFPVVQGQWSIDNEFLLVWVTAGYVGLTGLILIFVEATITFGRLGISARTFQDCYLNFSLLGIVLGMAVCLYTVWLSGQAYILFFMIMGWSQSIRSIRPVRPATVADPQPVAMHIYT